MGEQEEAVRYQRACQDSFWQQVFAAELAWLQQHVRGQDRVLSVGCGPATLETALVRLGYDVVGVDVSLQALAGSTTQVRAVAASAHQLPFADATFDVVLFVVSLQFVEEYQSAITEAARVLRPQGRIIVLLLNPASAFFKGKSTTADSYVAKIRHTDLGGVEAAIAGHFIVQSEYFLGIAGRRIFASSDPDVAALYIVHGRKIATAQP